MISLILTILGYAVLCYGSINYPRLQYDIITQLDDGNSIDNPYEQYLRQNQLATNSIHKNHIPQMKNELVYDINQQSNESNNPNIQQLKPVNHLLRQINTASVTVLFLTLMWRSLALHEMAKEFQSDLIRYSTLFSLKFLLLINIIGCIMNVMNPMRFKTFLKMILAMNIFQEWTDLSYNIVQIVFYPIATGLPKGFYFGRCLMNMWFLLMDITHSRVRWVAKTTVK